jgi:small subunit ribosomal protein S15
MKNGVKFMARLHVHRKGKAGSEKPVWTQTPQWIDNSSEDVTKLVIEKAREGLTSAQIGSVLRDQHGIPVVKRLTGKSVTSIMKENNLQPSFPEDFVNLVRKAYNLRNHLEKHKKDNHGKRGLQLVEAKVRRLVKYYKSKKIFPADFKYNAERAPMYMRK